MKTSVALLVLAAPLAVFAKPRAEVGGFVDAYFIPSANLEITGPGVRGDDDGDGFGVRGMAPVGERLSLSAEYQGVTYDDSDLDVDQLRFGLGIGAIHGGSVIIEYIDVDLEGDSADGFGIHGRLASAVSGGVQLYGQIGFVSLDDDSETLSGLEGSVGLAADFTPNLSGVADYRLTSVEGDDSDVEFEFSDLRLGLRLHF